MAFSSQRRKSVTDFVKKRPTYPGLEETFRAFCIGKQTDVKKDDYVDMDGKTFAKLFKDVGVLGTSKKQLSSTSIDIIFSKCKNKGERRIAYLHFLEGVELAAKELGLTYEALCQKVANCEGPKFIGTSGSTFVASTLDRPKNTEEVVLEKTSEIEGLRGVFEAFNAFGGGDRHAMPNDRYIKLCKECAVIDKKYDATACDLVFSKMKPKGVRKLDYSAFKDCINMIAYQKEMGYKELAHTIVAAGGPKSSGTKADNVKFHDDKSLWTGAYGQMDQSDDRREFKPREREEIVLDKPDDVEGLEQVFQAFNVFGGGDQYAMPNDRYIKLCKECGVIDKKYDATACDLVFSKMKQMGERKIDYLTFMDCINLIAYQKEMGYKELAQVIISAGGPKSSGTKADNVKFHDDKSLWTGAYGQMDQSDNKREFKPREREEIVLDKPTDVEGLEEVFQAFNTFGGGDPHAMPNDRYIKLCKECGVIDGGYDTTACDLVFSKIKPIGERKIRYLTFMDCINLIAYQKEMGYKELAQVIISAGGPKSSGTKADSVKFHDDKSLWTGAYGQMDQSENKREFKPKEIVPVIKKNLQSFPEVEETFTAFCMGKSAGSGYVDMDGPTFTKLFKDADLLGSGKSQISTTSVDIIFSKAKRKGERRIEYGEFLVGVDLAADEMDMSYEELCEKIAACDGPKFTGTEGTTFHASTLDRQKSNLEVVLDKPTDVDGLEQVFQAFNLFGGGDAHAMPNDRYIKLCKETGVITKSYDATACDLVFSKIKPTGARKIDYGMFMDAINLIAYQKDTGYKTLAQTIVDAGGPVNSGTKADSVKFHDDKSLWTGAYGQNDQSGK